MFERYTEKARRVIFFGKYEASQFGSPYIETEHLLLGLLREDKALTNRLLRSLASVESIRKEIVAHAQTGHTPTGETTPGVESSARAADLPLSNESKRVLAYAAEEAERLSHKHIGTEHLLLGLLREEKCFASEILHQRGLSLSAIREELARAATEKSQPQRGPASAPIVLQEFSRDVTQAAMDNQLDPVVGREAELQAVVQVLCRRTRSNPVLIGEPGVGRTAIVEGLALRIADGDVPAFLADKRLLFLDLSFLVTASRSARLEERLRTLMIELEARNCVIFLGELYPLTGEEAARDAANVLKFLLACGFASFIATMTPLQQRALEAKEHWIGRYFCPVKVLPLTEGETLNILHSLKERYERFHAVNYTDEAISAAVHLSALYVPDRHLPGKALDLLDDAGANVKLSAGKLPDEVVEVQKRIKFIVHRLENAIATHQFEKAKFYSDEERKERETLRELREKYHLEGKAPGVVTRDAVVEVLAHKIGMRVEVLRQHETSQ